LKESKETPTIDIFALMMNGDRLKNAALMENMKCYEELLGGQKLLWKNIVIVLPKNDFNPNTWDDMEEWEEYLVERETEAKDIVKEQFGEEPLGVIAIS